MTEPSLSVRPLQKDEISADLAAAISRLLFQLDDKTMKVSRDTLLRIVLQPQTNVYVAALDGKIVGTVTAVRRTYLSRESIVIEDLVVDSSARGRGVGRRLMEEAMNWGRQESVDAIDLTSGPQREAANTLYQSLGFIRRTTNVYRLEPGNTRSG